MSEIPSNLIKAFESFNKGAELLRVLHIDDFNTLLMTGEAYKFNNIAIKPSRTTKVVVRDNFVCSSCHTTAKYVTYQSIADAVHMCFWVDVDSEFIPLTKDHIVPKALGGTNTYSNLQSMCFICNQKKSDAHTVNDKAVNNALISKHDEEIARYKTIVYQFKKTRKAIKKTIKRLPLIYRIMGVEKYLNKHLVSLLEEMGYRKDEG